jgi:hypothetical protein
MEPSFLRSATLCAPRKAIKDAFSIRMRSIWLLPSQKPENQQVRGLERGDRDIGEIFIPFDHMIPDHGAKLVYRNT